MRHDLRPSRRALLIGAPATMAVGSASRTAQAAPVQPDARLLTLCAECMAHARLMRAMDTPPTANLYSDEESMQTVDAWFALVRQITHIPARTPEGIRAKAETLGFALRQLNDSGRFENFDNAASHGERLAMSLVNDLAAVTA